MPELHASGFHAFHDAEQLSHALRHTEVSAIQTSKGRFQSRLGQVAIHDWTLQYVSFLEGSAACNGSVARDRNAFIIPLAVGRNCRLLGADLDDATIGVYAPGAEHGDASTAPLAECVLSLPSAQLAATLERLEVSAPPATGSSLRRVSPDRLAHARQVVADLAGYVEPKQAGPAVARGMIDTIELTLTSLLGDPDAAASTGRMPMPRRAVLRAVADLIRDSDSDVLFATELAAAAGISYPTLRRVFIEWFGVSPVRYLSLKRLYQARNRLLGGEFGTVSEAATSCGFWELGRFASRYRETFGELPSATLGRGQARVR